jgi:restriction endonuclease S subunit
MMENSHMDHALQFQGYQPLEEICYIQTGCNAAPSPNGDIRLLQPRNFESGDLKMDSEFAAIEKNSATIKHILNPGAVIIASKGTSNFAWHFQEEDQPVVASTSFFVLYLRTTSILPEYLSAVLNSSSYQQRVKLLAQGGTVQSVPKSSISKIPIPILSYDTQIKIGRLSMLVDRRSKILKELLEKEKEFFDSYLLTLINKSSY